MTGARVAALVTVLVAALGIKVFAASQTSAGRTLLEVASRARLVDLRVLPRDDGDETVEFESDGLRITAALYRPRPAPTGAAVVVVHGGTRAARRLALYTLLGRDLAGRGHLVLAIDLRGFGDSDRPRSLAPEEWAVERDVVAAVGYLLGRPEVDPGRIHVVGHSMGAAYALAAAASDPRIAKVAAVSSPRRVYERVFGSEAPDRDAVHRRFTRLVNSEQPVPLELFMEIASAWKMTNYVDHFTGGTHQQLLLVDMADDRPGHRGLLEAFYERVSEPKDYVTIPGADHYANSRNVKRAVVYDRRALRRLSDVIDGWIAPPTGVGNADS
jgi:pimeloyl-ACP methyl ester carboxylesterase